MTNTNSNDRDSLMPRIVGPIADTWMIERGSPPNCEWLTPDREWHGSVFEAAAFELDDRELAEWCLQREIDDLTEKEIVRHLSRTKSAGSNGSET